MAAAPPGRVAHAELQPVRPARRQRGLRLQPVRRVRINRTDDRAPCACVMFIEVVPFRGLSGGPLQDTADAGGFQRQRLAAALSPSPACFFSPSARRLRHPARRAVGLEPTQPGGDESPTGMPALHFRRYERSDRHSRRFQPGGMTYDRCARDMTFAQSTSFSQPSLSLTLHRQCQPETAGQQTGDPPPRPDLVRQPYSDADVDFMAGHDPAPRAGGADRRLGRVARRPSRHPRALRADGRRRSATRSTRCGPGCAIAARRCPTPNATHHRMKMNGVEHDMLMPGMLTPEELAALDKARGPEWDRLFLRR